MEGCFMFQWGGVVFQMGGCPMGGHRFWWGGFEKKSLEGGAPPSMPPPYGKPCHLNWGISP